jgi:hypothetical protein
VSKTIKQVDFMVPLRTVSELNSREHWTATYKRRQDEEQIVAVAMQNNLRGRQVEMPCVVKLTRIAPRRLDSHDNLRSAFKATADFISRKLGVNDGDGSITWEYDQMSGQPKQYAVRISITSQAQTSSTKSLNSSGSLKGE